jgi:hypothetical protein
VPIQDTLSSAWAVLETDLTKKMFQSHTKRFLNQCLGLGSRGWSCEQFLSLSVFIMWPFLFCIFLGKLDRGKSRTSFSKFQTVEKSRGRLRFRRFWINSIAAVPAKFAKQIAPSENFSPGGKCRKTPRNRRKVVLVFRFSRRTK